MDALRIASRGAIWAGLSMVGIGFIRAGIIGQSDYLTAVLSGTGLAIAIFGFLAYVLTGEP